MIDAARGGAIRRLRWLLEVAKHRAKAAVDRTPLRSAAVEVGALRDPIGRGTLSLKLSFALLCDRRRDGRRMRVITGCIGPCFQRARWLRFSPSGVLGTGAAAAVQPATALSPAGGRLTRRTPPRSGHAARRVRELAWRVPVLQQGKVRFAMILRH